MHYSCHDFTKLQSKPLFCNSQPLSGDDHPLDLSSALVYLVNLGVPHQLLHGVLRVESIPTKYLNSIRSRLKKMQVFSPVLYAILIITLLATSPARHLAMDAM